MLCLFCGRTAAPSCHPRLTRSSTTVSPKRERKHFMQSAHAADPSGRGGPGPGAQPEPIHLSKLPAGAWERQTPPPLVETPGCQHHLRMEWADMQRMLAGRKMWQEINTVPAREPAPGPGRGWQGGAGFPSDAEKWPVHHCERTVHSRGGEAQGSDLHRISYRPSSAPGTDLASGLCSCSPRAEIGFSTLSG